VELRDGIGGQMELARLRQAVIRKPHGRGVQTKAVNLGTAMLNAAADRTLKENSEKIVKSLLDGIISGNATSAKLLCALAEGQINFEDETVMKRLYSYAEKLASEPEWNSEKTEASAENSIEESEPEE
jgi:hypothetical protein